MSRFNRTTASGLPIRGLASAVLNGAQTLADLRSCAPLPPDAQRLIDEAVVQVQTDKLQLVEDLLVEGLTRPLPNWMGVPTLYQRRSGRAGHAQRTMVPKARGERQIQQEDGLTVPIFVTWDDFSFDARTIATAQRAGYAIETEHINGATRNVNEAVEDQSINGMADEQGNLLKVEGHTAPGILNATGVHAYQYLGGAEGRAWDDPAKTGEHILADVNDMMEEAGTDNYTGPYNLYVNRNYGYKLNTDYKSATSGTILSRLQELEAGGRPLRVRVLDKMPTNRVALIQMTNNVIDVVDGQRPAQVGYSDDLGFEAFSIVMACMIVRVKSDFNGGSGIVVGNVT